MSAGSGSQDYSDELLDDQQEAELLAMVERERKAERQRRLRAELQELVQRKQDFALQRASQTPREASKRASSHEFDTPVSHKRARTAVSSAAPVIDESRPGLGIVSRAIKSPRRDVPNPSILKALKASERIREAALGSTPPSRAAHAGRGDGRERADDDDEDDDDRSQREDPLREPIDLDDADEEGPVALVYLGGKTKVQAHPFVAKLSSQALPFYKALQDSNDTGTSAPTSLAKLAKDIPSVEGVSPVPRLKRDKGGEAILRQVHKSVDKSKESAAKYSAKSEEYKADEKLLADYICLHKATTSAWNQLEHILRPATDVDGVLAPEIQISDPDKLRGAFANLYKDSITVHSMAQTLLAGQASAMTAKIMAECGVDKDEINALTKKLHIAAHSHPEKTFLGSAEVMRDYEERFQHRIDINSQKEILSRLVQVKKGDFFASRPRHTRGRGGGANRGRGATPPSNASGQSQQSQQPTQRGRGTYQNRGRGGRGQPRQQPDSTA